MLHCRLFLLALVHSRPPTMLGPFCSRSCMGPNRAIIQSPNGYVTLYGITGVDTSPISYVVHICEMVHVLMCVSSLGDFNISPTELKDCGCLSALKATAEHPTK